MCRTSYEWIINYILDNMSATYHTFGENHTFAVSCINILLSEYYSV